MPPARIETASMSPATSRPAPSRAVPALSDHGHERGTATVTNVVGTTHRPHRLLGDHPRGQTQGTILAPPGGTGWHHHGTIDRWDPAVRGDRVRDSDQPLADTVAPSPAARSESKAPRRRLHLRRCGFGFKPVMNVRWPAAQSFARAGARGRARGRAWARARGRAWARAARSSAGRRSPGRRQLAGTGTLGGGRAAGTASTTRRRSPPSTPPAGARRRPRTWPDDRPTARVAVLIQNQSDTLASAARPCFVTGSRTPATPPSRAAGPHHRPDDNSISSASHHSRRRTARRGGAGDVAISLGGPSRRRG